MYRAVRLYVSNLLNLGSILVFYRIVVMVRFSRYDAGVLTVIATAPHLFRVIFRHVNGLNPALLPATVTAVP